MANLMGKMSNLNGSGMISKMFNMAVLRTFSTSTVKASHAFRSLRHIIGAQGIVLNRTTTISFHNSSNRNGESDFKCAAVFKTMADTLAKDGESIVKKVNGIYGFNVKNGPNGEEGTWIVDAKNGNGTIEFGGKATPDVTLTMNDSDLLDMMTGKLEPQKAFFKGQLKIKGNMGLAMKLKEFQAAKKE